MELKLADIQKAVKSGDYSGAEKLLVRFVSTVFGLDVTTAEVRRDHLSLNSVNGFIKLKKADERTGADQLFFKFHQEENEEALAEYYNSQLLLENGYQLKCQFMFRKKWGSRSCFIR